MQTNVHQCDAKLWNTTTFEDLHRLLCCNGINYLSIVNYFVLWIFFLYCEHIFNIEYNAMPHSRNALVCVGMSQTIATLYLYCDQLWQFRKLFVMIIFVTPCLSLCKDNISLHQNMLKKIYGIWKLQNSIELSCVQMCVILSDSMNFLLLFQ